MERQKLTLFQHFFFNNLHFSNVFHRNFIHFSNKDVFPHTAWSQQYGVHSILEIVGKHCYFLVSTHEILLFHAYYQ